MKAQLLLTFVGASALLSTAASHAGIIWSQPDHHYTVNQQFNRQIRDFDWQSLFENDFNSWFTQIPKLDRLRFDHEWEFSWENCCDDREESSVSVPEPGTIALMLIGALGVVAMRRSTHASH